MHYSNTCTHCYSWRTLLPDKVGWLTLHVYILTILCFYTHPCTEKQLNNSIAIVTMESTESTTNKKWWKCGAFAVVAFIAVFFAYLAAYDPSELGMVQTLREQYKNLQEIDFEQYIPKSMNPKQIPFITPNIKLVDEYPSEDTFLSVQQLLESVESGTRLAITGRPGVGKSTLARHIVKLWANREALQQFSTIFHVCLGKASTPIMNIEQLVEEECLGLVDSEDPELEIHKLLQRIKTLRGRNTMFVLDGFDEYFPNYAEQKNELILKLIKGTSLSKSAIIIMSRPRSVDDVRSYFKKVVEVTGFRRLDIETSLLSLGLPLRTVIEDYFDSNPNVKKMCYLPLHMTMIIYLASLKDDALSGIDSETKIYTNFLYLTIEHYHKRHGLRSSTLNDCFEVNSASNSLCIQFSSICALAFNATIHHQQTFSSKELRNISIDADTLQKLSLFNIRKENRRQGSVDVFSFSHQTFRDFMSANYLILLPKNEQHKMIIKYANETNLRDLVWKFFFGLLGELKTHDQVLRSLFREYVSSGGYEQLPTKYYKIDLYPLAYAFETGMRHQQFVDLLDYARIVGPGNNHSLQIHIPEPMELRSFLNIEEGGDANIHFLFMKYTLEWTPVMHIKVELKIQPNQNPDQNFCTNYLWVILNGSLAEGKHSKEMFRNYCHPTQMSAMNTSTVILELEYFRPKKDVVNPQIIFNMFKSAIMTDTLLAFHFKAQMIKYLVTQTQKSLRERTVLEILYFNSSYISDDLSGEELSFIQLWNHFQKYVTRYNTYSRRQYALDFSDLRRFKIQQLLLDIDLENVCYALQSATKLEVLDLSSNQLVLPKGLTELFKSLPHLRVLDLSDNSINLNFIAKGFKFLKELSKLNMSGNIISDSIYRSYSQKESFGFHLKSLKKLESLDLSRILYGSIQHLAPGLRDLKNLRQLNLSCCMVYDSEMEELTQSLSLLKKVEVLDLSHNAIETFSHQLTLVLNQIKEVNLSHNLLNLPISELGVFQWSPAQKLRKLNLSHNFLCCGDSEFQLFIHYFFFLSAIQEVDLSDNTLFFGENIFSIASGNLTLNKTIRFFLSETLTKTVELNNFFWMPDIATKEYTACVCKFAGFEKNYLEKCLEVFEFYQKITKSNTTYADLTFIHDKVAIGHLAGISRNTKKINSIISDRRQILERIHAFRKTKA